MVRRRLPIGMQTFRKLREQDCYYVDKTAYIERLLDEGRRRSWWTRYTEGDLETVFAPELDGLDRERVREWYNGFVRAANPVGVTGSDGEHRGVAVDVRRRRPLRR
jgi:hypothetical protein